jgi:adenylate cyclase
MPENGFNRRLSAILSADAVGYSRLIAADEQATLSAFNGHMKELIEPEIAANHGRIVKLMGDGVLAEFVSVVDAMQAAVAIQRGMRDRDADLDEDRRLAFRIGVTFGEIVVDDGDIFGNGVNVAARLQEAAESGGIMISDRVHEDVRGKIDVLFDDLGPQAFKNLPEKIRVFRVLFDNKHPVPARTKYSFRYSVLGYGLAFGAVVCLVGVVLFWRQSQYPESSASKKPSIAVLPFENKSNDRKQDYFAYRTRIQRSLRVPNGSQQMDDPRTQCRRPF